MSLATLLTQPDQQGPYGQETFSFEHANAHRTLFGAMGIDGGLSRFSVLPYKMDPHYPLMGGWKLDHGQAHHDFQVALPGWYTFWGITPATTLTINTGQNFIDPNLANAEQLNWWVFANHTEHLIAESVTPLTTAWVFPFW